MRGLHVMSMSFCLSVCLPHCSSVCRLFLPPTKEEVNAFARVCLSVVCLLARLLKMRAWIWMKCCVSTDIGTWTNCLTFEPDPVIVRLPEPDCFLRYRISYATRNFTSGTSDVLDAAARRGFKLFYGPSLQRRVVLQWYHSLRQ